MTALDHGMPFSRSTTESLKHFIQGHTKENHPIDVVRALYNHPYAHLSHRYEPSYLPLPEFTIPLNDHQPVPDSNEKGCTYSELQQYFVDQSLKHTKFEMNRLLHEDYWHASSSETGRFDWDVVLGFSIESIQIILMTKAPVIWMLLTLLAVEHHRPQLAEARTQSKQGGQGSNNARDPYLVSDKNPSMLPSLQAPI